jgi:hypothetical protein
MASDDLYRRLPNPLPERSGQVRLIEVAGLIYGIENRHSFAQEIRRMSGTFDLPPRRVGDAGRAQKMALSGSQG